MRGAIANGVARFEAAKAGQPPPVWFVFSGAPLCCPWQHAPANPKPVLPLAACGC